ncbi:type IV pilin protein [Desulfurobacterium crinifex]
MLVRELVQKTRREGFSLVELMVVVAIIAILAAIAIPQYKKYQLKAKTSEAKMNIGAIRSAEEAYSAENDYYILTNWAPEKIPGTAANTFAENGTNNGTNNGFDKLGFAPAGKVYYSYAVLDTSDQTADDNSANDTSDDLNGIQVKADATENIHIWAVGDLDGDGDAGNATDVSSLGNNSAFMSTDEDPKIIDKNPGHF